jgi:hypothetical protein
MNTFLRKLHRILPALALVGMMAAAPVVPAQNKSPKPTRKRTPASPEKPAPAKPAPVAEAIREDERKQLAETASQSRTNLIAASNAYRESLERLLDLQRQDETNAVALVEKRRNLLELGVISRRELEESEQSLNAARARLDETRKHLGEVDQLVAEVNAAEQLAKLPPEPQGTLHTAGVLIRYVGSSRWALSDFGKVDAFFRLTFNKPLPVSAIGQTETHNRLGFDHREALDVAIHPDSAEGQSLIQYLRGQGISFIAIRSPIPGSATGAHIHIGPPSRRIGP